MLRRRCVSFRLRCGRPVAEALFGPVLDCCLGSDGGLLDPMEGEEDEFVLMRGGGGGCILGAADGALVVVEVAIVLCRPSCLLNRVLCFEQSELLASKQKRTVALLRITLSLSPHSHRLPLREPPHAASTSAKESQPKLMPELRSSRCEQPDVAVVVIVCLNQEWCARWQQLFVCWNCIVLVMGMLCCHMVRNSACAIRDDHVDPFHVYTF